MFKTIRYARSVLFAGVVIACGTTFMFGQTITFKDGKTGQLRFDQRLRIGPAQRHTSAGVQGFNSSIGLPFFTANYNSFGTPLRMNIVGTDPSIGPATTIISTVIVPLRFVFAEGTVLDGNAIVPQTIDSPIFRPAAFNSGGTDIGLGRNIQYGDAIQRAEFWTTGGSSLGYHVILSQPAVLPSQIIVVPASQGLALPITEELSIGLVNAEFVDPIVTGLVMKLGFTPNVLPVFLSHNVFEYNGDPSKCCIAGYHNSTTGPITTAQTWLFATYPDEELFGPTFADTLPLSHEIAEWLNDPFVGALPGVNLVPPASLQAGCIFNYETGDPLSELPDPSFVVNGHHLQDEAYLWWYLHTTPSPATNGSYSFLGNFTSPSTLCGPG